VMCITLAIIGGSIAITAYMLYLYATYKDNYCEKDLTRYTLAAGILGAISNLVSLIQLCANLVLTDPDPNHPLRKLVANWNQLSGCASLGILITGSAWVFAMNRDSHVCPSELYNFVWGYILFCWVFIGAIICCVGCCLVLAGGNPAALRAMAGRNA